MSMLTGTRMGPSLSTYTDTRPHRAGAAGIFPFGPTHEATETDFDRVYAVNAKAQFFLVAELAPGMAKRGHGAIVNVTTMVAEFGMPGMGL